MGVSTRPVNDRAMQWDEIHSFLAFPSTRSNSYLLSVAHGKWNFTPLPDSNHRVRPGAQASIPQLVLQFI